MKTPPHTPSRTGAFTLIELLVVIAIISLLVSLTLPALSAAKQQARTVKCLSNIRQTATAVNAFTTDHKGELPENRVNVGPNKHVTWRHNFVEQKYLPEGDIWACPAPPPTEPRSELDTVDQGSRCVGDVASNWALNGHLLWRINLDDEEAKRPAIVIRRTSHTILLTETRDRYPDLRITDDILSAQDEYGGWFGFWHQGKGSYAFVDGHAVTLALKDTGDPDCRWHNGLDNTQDIYDPQERREVPPHGHPEWVFTMPPIYR